MTKIGPNVRRLIARKMALDAIPPGTPDPFQAGLDSLVKPGALQANAKSAANWVRAAIAAVKAAPDNPYGDDDEVIAGELLRRIKERDDRSAQDKDRNDLRQRRRRS